MAKWLDEWVALGEDRDVAVKILPPDLSRDESRFERCEREARTARSLSHPNLLTVHDFGEEHGQPYLTLPRGARPSSQRP
jgi:eukaryotic-like serine/threonine-protein kinase